MINEISWKQNAALFLTGQAVSIFGSMLVQYAIVWYITLTTGSGSMMTIFILAGFLPMFFISPFGGVWADRFNRKYLINAADGFIALITLGIALCFLAGFENIWLLLVCAALRGLGQGVQNPATSAFIPQIVPQKHLTRVGGINSGIQSSIMIIAPMISGALLQFSSIKFIFFIDVITAAIGISIVFFCVKVPARPRDERDDAKHGLDYFHDLREGLRYIRAHGFILRLMIISALFFIAIAPAAFLTQLQITRNFGGEVWRLSAMEVSFAGGMMLGGFVISLWGGFKNRSLTMALACALFGVTTIGLGLAPDFVLYCAIMAVMGVTMPFYNTPAAVMFQTNVEDAFMGRVFSVFTMISSLMVPAGMILFGPLADIVSIDILLVVTGAALCLLALPFIASRTLRLAGAPR